ncbi:hypothetical protein GGR32_002082 [Mesonia hippocampi]|uniref:Uncharacterized protein n=1 Tax=Mesonia hippocampi TaxID=1628250 RepID=A0A840EW50_9FLAO|nr:hypothetical protein [Mesonia hippocampi]MBB4119776.1 hypothetical protein [Mesonia hippocampi]
MEFFKLLFLLFALAVFLGVFLNILLKFISAIAYFTYASIHYMESFSPFENHFLKLIVPEKGMKRIWMDFLASLFMLFSVSSLFEIIKYMNQKVHSRAIRSQEQDVHEMLELIPDAIVFPSLFCIGVVYIISYFHKRKMDKEELDEQLKMDGIEKIRELKLPKFFKLPF